MTKRSPSAAENLIEALEEFARGVERFASRFLEALLRFIHDAANWLDRMARRVLDYAVRLFPALGHLIIAFVKLLLMFTPAFVFGVIGLINRSVAWLVVAFLCAGFILLIGLSYRSR